MSAPKFKFVFLFFGAIVVAIFAIGILIAPNGTSTAAPTQFAAITRLTYDPGNATHPAWSPDNQTIAFESNRDGANHIYIMNADGTHSRALTFGANDDRHAAWMPDGKNILYDSSAGMHQDIWIVNAENGNRKQLTRVNGLADYAASSPDGQRIAFYVYKEMTLNIWSARADGSDAKQLTRDFANAKRYESTISWGRPAWSPDGQSIAYTGADGKSIWLMGSDGTGARAIIADEETNHFPFFLADGRLAFITEYVPPRYGAAWTNAWAYDIKTGQRTLLHEFMSMQEPLAWNTDISKLLFASPRNGRFDIYLIDTRAPGGIAALRDNLNVSSAQSGEVNR